MFLWNLVDLKRIRWEGPDALSAGKHSLEFDFEYDGMGGETLAFNNMTGIDQSGTGVLKVGASKGTLQSSRAKSRPIGLPGLSRSSGTMCSWSGSPTRAIVLLLAVLIGAHIGETIAQADSGNSATPSQTDLVNQANAPISNLFQVRLQDSYAPAFQGQLRGQGNFFSIAVGMPLPAYRLLPLPQLSLLTIPVAATLPLPLGSLTGFGDIRFVDIAVIDAGHSLLFGIGPTFVFPTASDPATGQGKWQVGPAVAAAFAPRKWLFGVLAQNPISFAGDSKRPAANALVLQPFITYQLGQGWFVRSEPQMVFDWETGKQLLPIDAGIGRVFKIGPQYVNCFIEPAWNVTHDAPAPRYAITFGFSLLYPNFWGARKR